MSKRGFSLIELLVVVAILTLLAAIAIPNLMDAQVRSRVAKAHSDMADLSRAVEAYFIDHKVYPATDHSLAVQGGWGANRDVGDAANVFLRQPTFAHRNDPSSELAQLTTPIAYINTYPADPFSPANNAIYSYSTPDEFSLGVGVNGRGWVMWSLGPGGKYTTDNGSGYTGPVPLVNVGVGGQTRVDSDFYNPKSYIPSDTLTAMLYDPTNGLRSPGIITRFKQ